MPARSFTRPSEEIFGPKNIAQLKRSTACVAHYFVGKGGLLEAFAASVVAPNDTESSPYVEENNYSLPPGALLDGTDFCTEAVAEERADIFVMDRNAARLQALSDCDN